MVDDIQKYRAQMFQVMGFAFMTPLGSFILGLKDVKIIDITFWSFIYFSFSLVLAHFGIILFNKGQDELIDIPKERK